MPDLAVIGLIQPIGSVSPISEMQVLEIDSKKVVL
jgi:hypothetical protein